MIGRAMSGIGEYNHKALIFTKSALILPEGIFIPENLSEGQKTKIFLLNPRNYFRFIG